MGETVTEIRIRGPKKSAIIRAVVDTGATNTVLSEELARELGIESTDADEVVLANGSVDKVGIASAEVEIQGIKRTVPVYIYRGNLIGLTTLEAAGLRVNPVSQQLEKVPGKLLFSNFDYVPVMGDNREAPVCRHYV
jgi:clan AA aspartic protease